MIEVMNCKFKYYNGLTRSFWCSSFEFTISAPYICNDVYCHRFEIRRDE